MVVIILGILLVIPWTVTEAGGFSAVEGGLSGINGSSNIFNPAIVFSFGLVTSIGLISQTITDQQYWQRVFALKDGHIGRAFLFGALLFAIVPIAFSMLGFIAANPDQNITISGNLDKSLIGVVTVSTLLPKGVAVIFTIVLLAGLSSTIDSGISAASALWATDVAKYPELKNRSIANGLSEYDSKLGQEKDFDKKVIRKSRTAMIMVTLFGLAIGYASHYIVGFNVGQLFLLSISVAASASMPTVLSLYRDNLSEKGVFWGVLLAMLIGMPLFVTGNLINNQILVAIASLSMILISAGSCIVFSSVGSQRRI